ncbi:hypothetical protein [Nocardiopsis rhodophaea]|uniref:hypothetical protein n=1 Tax=Nocardiopsis rhodophaea TaxID=280238 RepID=UPI0031D246DB
MDLDIHVTSGMSTPLSVVRRAVGVLVLISPEAEPDAVMIDARRMLSPRERMLLRIWLEGRSQRGDARG